MCFLLGAVDRGRARRGSVLQDLMSLRKYDTLQLNSSGGYRYRRVPWHIPLTCPRQSADGTRSSKGEVFNKHEGNSAKRRHARRPSEAARSIPKSNSQMQGLLCGTNLVLNCGMGTYPKFVCARRIHLHLEQRWCTANAPGFEKSTYGFDSSSF